MGIFSRKYFWAVSKAIASKRYMWIIDILLILFAHICVSLVAYPLSKLWYIIQASAMFITYTVAVYIMMMLIFKNYRTIWQHASFRDFASVLAACLLSGMIVVFSSAYFKMQYFYVKLTMLSSVLTFFFVTAYRICIKFGYVVARQYFSTRDADDRQNVLVVGAGSAGAMFVNDVKVNLAMNYNIVGFVDDDPKKLHSSISGIYVIGNRDDIPYLCKKYKVAEILVAIPTITPKEKHDILNICIGTKCKVKIMPSLDRFIEEGGKLSRMRSIKIDDLLAREPIVLDDSGISEIISGKTIMVTGGGGSIGSELCRQLVRYKPKLLIIVDIYENNAYDLQNELIRKYPNQALKVLIASVRDKKRLDTIFSQYHPDIVYHAAAHKHVPLMEYSPSEAIKNNVFGTFNVARCADEFNVSKFVMISTDKAVNPTNVMGATKRMCELIVQAMQKVSKTQFVAVRFGNVLGSNGSVIPLFEREIAEGGPVTVTDREITRFFMTIPEAAQLVIQASCFADGGEIFVLDMGEPVKIYDLAQNLIKLSGYTPGKDMEIKITGLRPGEKLYEELLMNEEGLKKTCHSKIYIGKPLETDLSEITDKLSVLTKAIETYDNEKIRDALASVVPTYTPDKTMGQSREKVAAE